MAFPVESVRFGIGWRPELALMIERSPRLDFIEVVAESVALNDIPAPLEQLRARGATIVPHGIGLSLGGAEHPDPGRLAHLARLAERFDAPMVSEHLAFVRAGQREAGHLLPLPRTREALDVLAENIRQAQAALPVPLALENVASLFEWPGNEMTEVEFIREAIVSTGAMLLLDVANLYANVRNYRGNHDPGNELAILPLDRLAYVHVAGGHERNRFYHDTHAHSIPAEVLVLLEELCARVAPPAVVLERDDRFPAQAELRAELEAVREAVNSGRRRRRVEQPRTEAAANSTTDSYV